MTDLVQTIANILYDKNAKDIVALDVSKLTVITDCMLIASGRNTIQVRAMAEEVDERLSEMGIEPTRKEGFQDAHWIVMDYGTVLVHIFHEEERNYYRLEKLWEQEDNRIPLVFEDKGISKN